MRTLLFQNNVHNTEPVEIPGSEPRAVNLTVRKGFKWADLKMGEIIELRETPAPEPEIGPGDEMPPGGVIEPSCDKDVQLATIYDVKVMSFADLMNYPRLLKLEHDPECRTYKGLFETMRRVYDGFLQHELVTLVMYELDEPKCSGCGNVACDCKRPAELE